VVSDSPCVRGGIRFLDDAEVRRHVTVEAAIPAVHAALTALSEGRIEQPDRHAFHGDGLVMAAHDRSTDSSVVKLWSGRVHSPHRAWGTVLWDDPRGRFVAGAGSITSLRTAAAVGAATDMLAPAEAHRLALLGTGHLALDQVRAVRAVRPIDQVTVWSRGYSRAKEFAVRLREELPDCTVRAVSFSQHAVRRADVVCCATPATQPLFQLVHLKRDVHVNAVGSFKEHMHELPQSLLGGATQLVVDQRRACLRESGEIIQAVHAGRIRADDLVELGELTDRAAGGRTMFKSVGVAAQDWAIGKLLADLILGENPQGA
jgi:ornithine cyclodeaminase